ncbi:hypothetical protein EV188_101234 [Actinomycetospora succinea]|uniref:Uncharacterized protein n=1 Tax=Actinomycetospora succinea TaxID=663603 RepID=A0A4R6VWU6_9PSEU|nr:hypothetical protein [Actinomycetospora succinea]TDQ64985.1 hypothetical protein EV188_101234 [Actinomycetospora succinea]
MASNAWERAQDAIAHAHQRATERDEDVVTPDTAVSPFDASSTTVLPHALTSRRGQGQDPDLTQRLQRGDTRRTNGHHRAPSPEDDEDATTVRFEARPSSANPGTSPFRANPFPGGPGPAEPEPERDETPAPGPEHRPWWKRLFGG